MTRWCISRTIQILAAWSTIFTHVPDGGILDAAWYWHLTFQVWIHPVIRNLQKPICCTRQAILVLLDGLVGSTKQFNSDFRRAAHCQWPMAEHIPYAIKLKEHWIKVYPNLGKQKHKSSPRAYEFVELDLNQRNTSQGLMNPESSKAPGMNAAHLVTGSLILEPCPYTWDTQTKVLVSLSSTLCSPPSPILEYIEWLKPHPTSQQLAAGA